jgi:uroporphyrin-III C-methyltransferase/precorrin-2 dehydrogenase/sirohydrochlorin ferrochelatase
MFLPIHIQMENRPCLIVGGSRVAARKCMKLLEYGARVTAVAPAFCHDPVWQQTGVTCLCQPYDVSLLDGIFLAIAATDDQQVNADLLHDAAQLGILAQRTDQADAGDFFLPATLRQGALTVSFGSDGVNPAFSRMLRDQAAARYDEAYSVYGAMTEEIRGSAAWQRLAQQQRKSGLRALSRCSGRALALIRSGKNDEARDLLAAAAGIKAATTAIQQPVCLIGAGPGDPGLITVKGAERLQQAEVVLYDGYANPLLLQQYCPDAEHIDVGKHKGGACRTQAEINGLMLEKAATGAAVVRLKGGDPLMFGRGGEEARLLAQHGIPFEIIPGVTSGLAAPTYAGIPVTDREFASSVGFYSMHKKEGELLSDQEWQRMAQGPDTLVLLMGSTVLQEIAENLIRCGRAPATPVALITKGTHPTQTRYLGTLATIAGLAERHRPERPGLVVVGDVVNVIPAMDWFPCVTISGTEA